VLRIIPIIFILSLVNKINAQPLPIDLQCVNTLSSGDVVLQWTPAGSTCGVFVSQDIYYSTNPSGPFSLLQSMTLATDDNYTHIGANGNVITYYYFISNIYNCAGVNLSTNSDTIDNLYPATPIIDYVTVINDQSVIQWQASSSPETFGYIIYYLSGATATPIDTVYGINNTSYIDIISTPSTIVNDYTIAAMDSCEVTGLFSITPQHNILLNCTISGCNTSVDLSWNTYDNWVSGVDSYRVYVWVNSGLFSAKAAVASTTNYTFTDFNDGDSVCLYIEAESNDGIITSRSNVYCFRANAVQSPDYIYIENLTVLSNQTLQVTYVIDTTADILNYNLLSGTSNTSWSSNTILPAIYPLVLNNIIDPVNGDPSSSPIYTQVNVTDSCNIILNGSQGRSIYLSTEVLDNYHITLQWSEFLLDNTDVINYVIIRSVNNVPTIIATVPNTILYYEDAPVFDTQGFDTICYYIRANYKGDFIANPIYNGSSYSNASCISLPTKIIAPNAFTPGGQNPIFRPYVLFIVSGTYYLAVMNRWGEVIFESNNPAIGWDGKVQNDDAPQGVYTWYVEATGQNGKKYKEKGSVLLLR